MTYTAGMNVILKAFEGPFGQMMMDEAFRGLDIGTCISLNNTGTTPSFPAKNHRWMSASDLRAGRYPGIDWNQITPLDEELVEKMDPCEAMFLSMIERYARHGDISYPRRKRQYFAHLRYWNHVLEQEKIGLYLLFNSPHQCYDYVIYELCKIKGIPTYNLEFYNCVNDMIIASDFRTSAQELVPAFERLRKEYADPKKPIPLSPSYDAYYQEATSGGSVPIVIGKADQHLKKTTFLAKWGDRAWSLLRRHPGAFVRFLLSPDVWARKIAQHRTAKFYDDHAVTPDLSQPYIYAPLHLQPEDAVTPRGGGFRNQELVIQLVAACLPPGVRIYVKEHPMQGELCRDEAFYRSMTDLPNVSFVPRKFSTFTLLKHCKAVATVTGTAGFEGLFFGKPCLMFGHRFYQYAPGVHPIHTTDDCKKAVDAIFTKGETPKPRDLRLFMKAMDDCATRYYWKPKTPEQLAEQVPQVRATGRKLREIISSHIA